MALGIPAGYFFLQGTNCLCRACFYQKALLKGGIALNEIQLGNAMKTYGDTVYRLALCRMQSTADAEDVYQDVFLRLMKQRCDIWDAEHMKAWLIRTTLNRCADLHRFRLRRPTLSLDEVPELASSMDESGAEVWEAVNRLPEKLRIPVHLHYGEGFSTAEIAEMTGVPASTVRTRLHRAREKLKDLLGGFDDA